MSFKNKFSLIIISILILLFVQPVFAEIAHFSASPTSGIAPLTVQFIDQSDGTITHWRWEYGDGMVNIIAGPAVSGSIQHTFSTPGTYTVTLTVNHAATTYSQTITVIAPTTLPTPTPEPTTIATTIPTTIPTTIVTTPSTIPPTTLRTEVPTAVPTTIQTTTSSTIRTTTATPIYTQETTLPITQSPTTLPTTTILQFPTASPTTNSTPDQTSVPPVATTTIETPLPVVTSTVAVPTVTQTIKDTTQISSKDGILQLTLGFPVLSVNATSADDRTVNVSTVIKDGIITFPTINLYMSKPISIRIDLNDIVYIIRRR